MRPVKLILSAFGPYAGEEVIAFDKLGEQGIYLVTGETGAGKTTVFDGITYALYGAASGVDRDARMFRSKYAKADTKTYVELEFIYKNKRYCVRRNPDYERPSLRGNKTTVEKADANLILPNGEIITKSKEVTKKIEEILGVNYGQFTKIVMIAQGAFKEFLFAETGERHDIFRKIFGTGKYYSLQIRLAALCKELEDECDEIRKSVDQYLRDTVCDPDSALALELEAVHEKRRLVEESLEIVAKIVEEDTLLEESFSARLAKLEDTIAKLNEEIGRGKQLEKTKRLLADHEEKLPDVRLAAEDAYKRMEEASKEEINLTKLSEELTILRKEMVAYDKVLEEENELKLEFKRREKLVCSNELLVKENEELAEVIRKEQEACKEVSNDKARMSVVEENKKRLEEEKRKLENYQNLRKRLERTAIELRKIQESYLEEENAYNQARKQQEERKSAFLREQAGILAMDLEEGYPCPVCGSISHPNLAKVSGVVVSKEELDRYGKQVEEKMGQVQELSRRAATYLASKKEQEESLKTLREELSLDEETNSSQNRENEIEEELKALEEERMDVESRIKRHQELETSIAKNLEKQKEQEDTYVENLAKIASLKGSMERREQQILIMKKELAFETRQEAALVVSEKEKNYQLLKQKIEGATKAYENAKTELDMLLASMDSCRKLLEQNKEINMEELTKQLEDDTQEKQKLQNQKEVASGRIATNKKAVSNIIKRQRNLSELERKSVMVKSLSDTANAKLIGKQKVELETYVQMAYFDRILGRANYRLLRMTSDQYELVRRKETDNLRSKVGLDLDVIDHFNGSMRSVKSLSGGESFKASLALALGLSDEIQCQAGGIQFDSMFIDEGFGSLDEESLKQAIGVLAELSAGNRLVGIISHVGELKERIDKQIVITKTKEGGSKTQISI